MSSQDRGGIRFPVVVADDLSGFDRFDARLSEIQARWEQFRQQIASLESGATTVGASFKPLADAMAAAAKAGTKMAGSTTAAKGASDELESTEKRLERTLKRRAAAAELVALADEKNLDISSRIAQAKGVEEEALASVIAQDKRQQVTARARQISDELGITTSKKKVAALSIEEAAKVQADKTERRMLITARARQLLEEKGIEISRAKKAAFDAVAAAQERINRAQQTADTNAVLESRGFNARTGMPRGAEGPALPPIAEILKPNSAPLTFMQQLRAEIAVTKDELGGAAGAAQGFFFTFRRLVGVFAVFQGIRLVVGAIRDAIRDSVRFSAEMENVELGVASLFVSVGQVRDALGKSVDTTLALALAQQEARRQVQLLRIDALRTAATFQDLAKAFQVAIAPGINAGLSPDQIRSLTVRLSQAAAAISLPQDQLPEEIRSLLQGTIQPRTTRIATALGITNEDIKRAKEAGDLAGFLEKKFQAFGAAANIAQGNFDVLFSNVKDGFEQLIGTGARGFFNELKGLLADVLTSLTSFTKDGIVLNPSALEFVKVIATGFKAIVANVREFISSLNSSELFQVSHAIKDAFELLAVALGQSLQLIVSIGANLSPLIQIVTGVAKTILQIFFQANALGAVVRGIVSGVLTWYITTKLLLGTIGLVKAAMTGIAALNTALNTGTALASLATPITAIAGLITLVASLFVLMDSSMASADKKAQSFSETIKSMAPIIEDANKSVEDTGQLLKQLDKELNASLDALAHTIATLGVKGAAAQELKALQEITTRLRDDGKEALAQQTGKQAELNALLAEQARLRQEIADASGDFLGFGAGLPQLVSLTRQAKELETQRLDLEEKIKTSVGSQTIDYREQLQVLRKQSEELADQANDLLPKIGNKRAETEAIAGGKDAVRAVTEAREKLLALAVDNVTVDGKIVAVQERLKQLALDRTVLEARIAASQLAQTEAAARRAAFEEKGNLATQRALLESQRVAEELRQFEDGRGNISGNAKKVFESRQSLIIERQKLELLKQEQEADEAATKSVIEQTAARQKSFEADLVGLEAGERRTKIEAAITRAVAARAAQQEELEAKQLANAAKRAAEEEKVANILRDTFRAIAQNNQDERRNESNRANAAEATLIIESNRLALVETEAARRFQMSEAEKKLLSLQAGNPVELQKLDALERSQAIKQRELGTEIETLRVERERAASASVFDVDDAKRLQFAADAQAATLALTAAETRLAEMRRADTAELDAQRLKILAASVETLNAIQAQSAAETLAARQRLTLSSTAIEAEKAREAVLKAQEDSQFRLADGARKVIEIESDLTAVRARLEITKQNSDVLARQLRTAIGDTQALQVQLEHQRDITNDVQERARLEREITAIIATRKALLASESAITAANAQELLNSLKQIQNAGVDALTNLRGEAVRNTFDTTQNAVKTEAEAAAASRRFEASQRLLESEREIGIARANLGPLEAELRILETANALQQKQLELTRATVAARVSKLQAELPGAKPEDQASIQAQINEGQRTIIALENEKLAAQRLNTAELALQNQKIDEQKLRLEFLKMEAEEPVKMGIAEALVHATDTTKAVLDVTKQAILGFASTVSGILSDALDPNKDVDIRERFAEFFRGLATSIINFLVQLAVVSAALAVIPGFADALKLVAAFNSAGGRNDGGLVKGFNDGGPVTHKKARGYNRGGRPRGLHPNDTIPAWLAENEYVIRAPVVQSVGVRTFDAINAGMVDPGALASVAGVNATLAPSRAAAGPGFAAGGAVSRLASAVQSAGAQSGAGGAEVVERLVVLPVLVANEQTLDTLIQGGDAAFDRHLARKKPLVRSMSAQKQGNRT